MVGWPFINGVLHLSTIGRAVTSSHISSSSHSTSISHSTSTSTKHTTTTTPKHTTTTTTPKHTTTTSTKHTTSSSTKHTTSSSSKYSSSSSKFITISTSTSSTPRVVSSSSAVSSPSVVSSPSAVSSSSAFSSSSVAGSSSAASSYSSSSAVSSSSSSSAVSSSSSASASSVGGTLGTVTSDNTNTTSSSNATGTSLDCSEWIQNLSFGDYSISALTCEDVTSGSTATLASGPSNCAPSVVPEIDIRRLTMEVVTSYASADYVEIWLPTSSDWNGRFLATDNKGLSGCASYDDMTYTSSLGFAIVGDSGGHNSTEYLGFDGQQFLDNNELVIDWSYRARHAAVEVAKSVIEQYYGKAANYNYMLGCSNGGRQAIKSASMYPDDFDGIIAGSSVVDFNHNVDWSGRMYVLTGADSSDAKFLTYDDWEIVHNEVLAQCDEPLDGVADGILEDSTICDFNATKLTCTGNQTSNCLTSTQTSTVWNVFSALYDPNGTLLYTRLAPGAELYSSTNGILHGEQGHVSDWFQDAVYNDSSWDASTLSQTDYTAADDTDALHGDVSTFSGDLSAFQAAGRKLIMYHGLMDPAASSEASQRYYLHVAKTMGLDNSALDDFLRYFRISGMYHCYGGPGAWAFGQDINARNASDNVIWNMVNWVENGTAPDTMTGTKWTNDDPSEGIEIQRSHCRFPYRTTYQSGNPNVTDSWSCEYITDWQDCGVGSSPRLC